MNLKCIQSVEKKGKTIKNNGVFACKQPRQASVWHHQGCDDRRQRAKNGSRRPIFTISGSNTTMSGGGGGSSGRVRTAQLHGSCKSCKKEEPNAEPETEMKLERQLQFNFRQISWWCHSPFGRGRKVVREKGSTNKIWKCKEVHRCIHRNLTIQPRTRRHPFFDCEDRCSSLLS